MNNIDFQNSVILVEEVLKKSEFEKTEIVYVNSDEGKRIGPFIRKIFDTNSGLGNVYKQIYEESSVHCDNLPTIYSVWEKETKLFVVEEFIVGKNLDIYIANQTFRVNELSSIFNQLCGAVNFLHTNFSTDIIHRDIKPSNILITKTGQVKLIDFGIARNFEEKANNDTHKFGTVGYASPEQFGFSQTDVRSDVYSLGKVLEFLYNPNNWNNINGESIPPQLNYIVKKACNLDPKDRYQSVAFLVKDFNKINNYSSSKVALILGHIWNILLSLVCLFFVVVLFATICDPSNVNYQLPVGQKICYCVMMIAFIFFGAWAVLSYKPSLRQIFNKLPRFKLRHYLIFTVACIAGVTIFALLAQLF